MWRIDQSERVVWTRRSSKRHGFSHSVNGSTRSKIARCGRPAAVGSRRARGAQQLWSDEQRSQRQRCRCPDTLGCCAWLPINLSSHILTSSLNNIAAPCVVASRSCKFVGGLADVTA
mmetsp:Transcript_35372/g.103634  ORF Transcript_35372/g.103634 Transcript_35372/m.103634 type:complete len:117 (+) Transcript_35372:419-769(+)